MNPAKFPESNRTFSPPDGYDASQVQYMEGHIKELNDGGPFDGAYLVITAWQPTPEEIQDIMEGAPVFLTCFSGLPPHFLSTNFKDASNPGT